jgi:hypothetical protein
MRMVKGFDTLDAFYESCIGVMWRLEDIVKELLEKIEQNPGNIYYLKLASLVRARILNDPLTALRFEHEISEVRRKDSALDSNTINSISML